MNKQFRNLQHIGVELFILFKFCLIYACVDIPYGTLTNQCQASNLNTSIISRSKTCLLHWGDASGPMNIDSASKLSSFQIYFSGDSDSNIILFFTKFDSICAFESIKAFTHRREARMKRTARIFLTWDIQYDLSHRPKRIERSERCEFIRSTDLAHQRVRRGAKTYSLLYVLC